MRIPFVTARKELHDAKLREATAHAALAEANASMQGLIETSWSKFVEPDPGEENWTLLSAGNVNAYKPQWETQRDQSTYADQLRSKARYMYRYESMARSAINSRVKFIWGRGATITPIDDNIQHKEAWNTFKKNQKWYSFVRQCVKRFFRDGEVFIWDRALRDQFASPRFVIIPPENIRPPKQAENDSRYSHGIFMESSDSLTPLQYGYHTSANRFFPLEPNEVIHLKGNCDDEEKRGRSFLEVSLIDISDYRRYRQSRARLNFVRSLYGVLEQVKGSPTKVSDYKNQIKGTEGDTDSKGREFGKDLKAGGHFITNVPDGVKFMSPNLQAGDTRHDAREIKLSIASGQDQSEVWLTADSQNANFSSQQVSESPAVIEVEGWQIYLEEELIKPIYESVIQWNLSQGLIDSFSIQKIVVAGEVIESLAPASTDCVVEWQGVVHRDLEKETNAYTKQHQMGLIDRRTAASKLGYNLDTVIENEVRDGLEKGDEVESVTNAVQPVEEEENVDDDFVREHGVLDATNRLAQRVGGLMETLKSKNGHE